MRCAASRAKLASGWVVITATLGSNGGWMIWLDAICDGNSMGRILINWPFESWL